MKDLYDFLLVIVGTFAIFIYILQERKKKIDAASLIFLQVNEIQERLREISGYITDDKLNETAFYESLPLLEESYWSKYKHYFVRDMDATSYASFNQLYKYVLGIQEQQLLMKTLQKNNFDLIQNMIANIESEKIKFELDNSWNGITYSQIFNTMEKMLSDDATEEDKKNLHMFAQRFVVQNAEFDYNKFWNVYKQQQELLKNIINNNALTKYVPVQIKISLDKLLKEYRMLEIIGTEGYKLLKKLSKKRI